MTRKTYVMSDIHGRFKAMMKLLVMAKVDFSVDKIYFLGDYVDWGENSVEVVKYLMLMSSMYENVKCTIGNHDHFTYKVLLGEGNKRSVVGGRMTYRELSSYNNGRATLIAFDKESEDEKIKIARWLEELPTQYAVKVGRQKYVLTHSSPQMYDMSPEELVWSRVLQWNDFDWEEYISKYEDTILVSGHTIVKSHNSFDSNGKCKIFFDYGHPYINIDCGAKVIGERDYAQLALLRLNDMKTWYTAIT